MYRRIFALAGLMALTGCPYTDGCQGLAEAEAVGETETPIDGGHGRDLVDAASRGHAASIDFGEEPGGGPALSTLSCPELAMPALAATVYVDANTTGTEAGTKTAPFRTFEKAFASASSAAIVWVAEGTYTENLAVPDKDLLVLGGFAPGFGSRTNACATVLEAANTSQPVLSASADVRSFAIEGLTIRKGARGILATGDDAAPSSFTIARCVFSENGDAGEAGGAVALESVDARLFRSVFRDNRASKGGALAANGSVTLTIDQNLFERNLGYADHGGGLYLSAKSARIVRNTFRGNATGVGIPAGFGGSWGGAVIVYNNSATAPASADFAFNVFTENLAGIGGAVFVDEGATITMSHDLLYRNRAYPENGFLRGAALYVDGTGEGPSGASTLTAEYLTVVDNVYDDAGQPGAATFGGNVYVEGFSRATFTNSIFWNNGDHGFYVEPESELTVSSSIAPNHCTSSTAEGFAPASATICKAGAGLFLPPDVHFADESSGDYHEMSTAGRYSKGTWVIDAVTSPAVDSADPAATVGNEPLPCGVRANLGAFGRTSEASKSPHAP